MKIKVPQLLLLPGILFFIILLLKGTFIHTVNPTATAALNTVCVAMSVSFISASTFLFFYGFFTAKTSNRKFLFWCFVGSAFLFLMFYYYYDQYSIINRSLDKFDKLSIQNYNVLPDLVQRARIDDSADRRQKWAHMAYVLYGVRLSYRRDGTDWDYYVPTQAEENDYKNFSDFGKSVKSVRILSEGLLNGAFNVVWFTFITFLFGLLWLAVKKPSFKGTS